jgi:hypothetical protein
VPIAAHPGIVNRMRNPPTIPAMAKNFRQPLGGLWNGSRGGGGSVGAPARSKVFDMASS